MKSFCKKGLSLFGAILFMADISGCASAYGGAQPYNGADIGADSVPISPNARLYTYFILVGMARGSIITGHLKRRDLPPLLAIDQKTRSAILQHMRHPTIRTEYDADQKLSLYLAAIPR